MIARMAVLVVSIAVPLWASCSPDGETNTLPGHSRPVLTHDWPHPGDLEFQDTGFTPPDPESVLVNVPAGLRAFVIPDTAEPLVEVTAVVPLGRHFEGEGEHGAAAAVAKLLERGLARRVGETLVADTRVSQEGGATALSVEVMAEDWRRAVTALVGTIREPGLTEWAPSASSIEDGREPGRRGGRAGALAELTNLVARYPIASPDPEIPTRTGSVRELGRRALHPEGVVLGIGGGVRRGEVERALLELTAGWDPGPTTGTRAHPPTLEAARIPAEPLHTVDVPGPLSWIALGHGMEAIAPTDEAAVAVLEEVVNIRLNIATREIRGLTNRAMLQLPAATDGAGLLYLRTSGRPESVAPLVRYSMDELVRIRRAEDAPTPEELEQAKGGLTLGWWQDSLDGARRTSATYALETARRGSVDHLLGWPGKVRAVTAEEVTAAARKYISPGAMTTVVLGPIDEVRPARHPRWPIALNEVPDLLRSPEPEP